MMLPPGPAFWPACFPDCVGKCHCMSWRGPGGEGYIWQPATESTGAGWVRPPGGKLP